MSRRSALRACLASLAIPSIAARPCSSRAPAWGTSSESLSRAIGCNVSTAGSPAFELLRTSWNRCWHSMPVAIAHPRSASEVATVVAWARDSGLPLRIRSGGHSFIGDSLCDGVIVDMRGLADVRPGPTPDTLCIGGGALIGDVVSRMFHTFGGRTCTLGTCNSVGVAGLLLGGGFNAMSRVHALTIDALVAAQVVLADGRVVRTDARSMPDLFWALRGGGASFGAVTEMTLRTRPWQPQYLVVQHWPWDRAADVLTAWSAWISSMPADSSSSLVWITSGTSRSSDIRTIIRSERGPAHADRIAAGLSAALRRDPARTSSSVSRPPASANEPRERGPRSANSSVFGSHAVPASAADTVAAAMEARRSTRGGFGGSTCMLLCNAFGGAVASVPSDATAFAHRHAEFLCEFGAEWTQEGSQVDSANRSWVRSLADKVRPSLGSGSYANYADDGLVGWRHAYWGAHLARLERIKDAIDPTRVFGGKQAI